MSNDTTITTRKRKKAPYVLVVHREGDVTTLCDALQGEFVVRTVATEKQAIARLTESAPICVVCVVAPTLRASTFFGLVRRAAPNHERRLVFVGLGNVLPEDAAFLKQPGIAWVPKCDPDKVVAKVRAVAAASADEH